MLMRDARSGEITPRVRQVAEEEGVDPQKLVKLVAQGRANKETAFALVTSENTVKYRLRNILDRLHLENRAQVMTYAARRGLGGSGTPDTP